MLGWGRGGQMPLLLAVLLCEMLFVAPLRSISWAEVTRRLPGLMAGAGALAALLIFLVRWSRAERRDFLRLLPYAAGTQARTEVLADLGAALLWGLIWPLLVPPRPHISVLWVGIHVWACAVGILSARCCRFGAGMALAVLGGALGPLLALGFGHLHLPDGVETLFWPWTALGLGFLSLAAWIPAWILRLPSHAAQAARISLSAWQDPASLLSYRLPLPWRVRFLGVFLVRGNLPLMVTFGIALAFTSFVASGSLHLGGFQPEPVSVLVGVGVGIPLALGLGAAPREFYLTRPLSRRRLLATAWLLGALLTLAVPAAGLWGLSRTPDAALADQIDQAAWWNLRQPNYLGLQSADPAELAERIQVVLRRETGLARLGPGHPISRPGMAAACRRHRCRQWVTAGLLGLLWFAGGLWIRMRQYASLEGAEDPLARREGAAALLLLLLVTLGQLRTFGWPVGSPPLPAVALAGVVALVGWMAWRGLSRLEVA